MKKFVAVLLAAVLCLSFAACGGDKATDKTVDAAAMFQALLTDVTYTDGATELDSIRNQCCYDPGRRAARGH